MIKCILSLCIVVLFSSCEQHQDRPATQQAPQSKPAQMKVEIPQFDGVKAFGFLAAQTDFGPRNPNSTGHRKCLQYLVTELRKYADDVSQQDFVLTGYGDEVLKLSNIFGSFNVAASDRILLLAHWDTRPRADQEKDPTKQEKPILGANDAASGVAILLELARLMQHTRPAVGVDILFVDGEDYGRTQDLGRYFLGARHFMKVKNESYKPRFAILLDMVGDRDLRIPMEQNSMTHAPEIVELIWSTAEKLGITQFVNVPGEEISDDHVPLNEGGIPTVDIIDFQYPYWHTLEDTPDKCSSESLEAVGTVLTHVVYSASAGELR